MKRLLHLLLVLPSLLAVAQDGQPVVTTQPAPAPVEPFELRDGDRVVFLGDTLFERERALGYFETLLTVQFPERKIAFRNLGWGADLPNGKSRASFDWNQSPDVWFRKLTNQVAIADPTVVFVGYGMAASFYGPEAVAGFRSDLGRLIDGIKANARHEVRFVLLTPIAHQDLGGAFPKGEKHNEDLKLYADAVRELGRERQFRVVDLFAPEGAVVDATRGYVETANGIHLTPAGYLLMASKVAADLGWPVNAARFGIHPDGSVRDGSYGAVVTDVDRVAKRATMNLRLEALPPAIVTYTRPDTGMVHTVGPERLRVQVPRLDEGQYVLLIDGLVVQEGFAPDWTESLEVARGPMYKQAEELRELIVRKNNLYLNRWRPQNDTYLFGFRKHEQGLNAAEVAQFDTAVARLDAEIHELKQPRTHSVEIRVKERGDGFLYAPFADRERKLTDTTGEMRQEDYRQIPVPFEVAEGFEVTLYAKDNLLGKPVQMHWGYDGKLYVAVSASYPQLAPGEEPNDLIMGIIDSDGDGVADLSHVVADRLQIPTGLLMGDGGFYVAHGTELLHLRDTNNDGFTDVRMPMLSAFGTEDTHHLLHSLQWGMDGQMYMNQSIYIHSHVETPTGIRRLNSGGVWAYRPATSELEVFLRGFCNPWGHIFDQYGQSFVTDGAGFQGVSWGVPGAMYFTYAGGTRLLDSISPGAYPKFSGLEVIETPNFPADWQGDLITGDFRAHRIVRFKLEEDGAGYVTREMPDLLRTTDVSFRPIDVKIGPDGALYIADWANPIIQHGEVDFRDPRRDKSSGRIWRVTYKGGPVDFSPNYRYLPIPQLFDRVHSPNVQIRRAVMRSLAERPTEMFRVLPSWTAQQETELEKLRALWLYQSIDRVNPPLLKELLAAKDHRVRAAATRVLSLWSEWMEGSQELLAEQSSDSHPRVRIEALRGLARTPSVASADLILAATDLPMDRFVEYAAWLSINDVADAWVSAIEAGEWKPEGREKQLAYGLKSIPADKASRVLGKLLPDRLSAEGAGAWIEIIGSAGGATELRKLYDQAVAKGFQPPALARALNALNDAARNRNLKPGGDLNAVATFLGSDNAEVRAATLRLTGAWKDQRDGFSAVVRLAGAAQTPEAERQLAFQTLREIGGGRAVEALLPLSASTQPLAVRQGAVNALAGLDLPKAAPLAMEVLNQFTDESAALALWRGLLNNRGAGRALAGPASSAKLSAIAANSGLRAVREGGRNEPELLQALTLASSTAGPVRELSDAEMLALAQKAQEQGDPHRGELVYRRPELGCVSCHAIGGVGGKVGPDMTSIGASAPADYLVESLLYPNRKIKEGYHSVVIETKDEQEFSGVLTRQTDTQIFIRNAADQEVAVAKNNIARQGTGVSLMPAGLIDALPEQERLDMIRFLTELGKPGPFDAARGNVARWWRLRQGTHRDEQFESSGTMAGLLQERGWNPVATLVDGRLPQPEMREALRTANLNNANSMVALWAHARFRTSQAGPVRLNLEGAVGAQVWVAGKPATGTGIITVELPAGAHDLLIKLHPRTLPENFKVSSADVTFLVE
ncbi:MAG TPA: PVC-type heme-binding CxxCH protein [Verrucomicrobiae bacterium]|nr:PVC-type heme-binding CxxCH protein [Verrucomicrobiae bacterium]